MTIIHGEGSPIAPLVHACQRIAMGDSTVLITGETGVGKEVFARYIHEMSPRAAKPFVTVHCAAIPEQLLESELFGYKRGAFTDARRDKLGRITLAEEGTLFLDEIGELSPSFQVKLLRVVQERCYEPVGALVSTQANFRLIAATNRDLASEVKAGRFRRDLYYRLFVCPIEIPPLRTRHEDIKPLFEHFWTGQNEVREVESDVWPLLQLHDWPGNVRELENLVERLRVCSTGARIGVEDLPHNLRFVATPRASAILSTTGQPITIDRPIDLPRMLQELEDLYIDTAMAKVGGVKKEAAALLGLNRTTLVEKLKRRGMRWNDGETT